MLGESVNRYENVLQGEYVKDCAVGKSRSGTVPCLKNQKDNRGLVFRATFRFHNAYITSV